MANFDSACRARISSVRSASDIILVITSVYLQAKSAQGMLNLYTGGTNPAFNGGINSMLTTSEKTEIGQALLLINALCVGMETGHAALISEG